MRKNIAMSEDYSFGCFAAEEAEKECPYGGGVYLKLRQGENPLRILPPAHPMVRTPFAYAAEHFFETEDGYFRFCCLNAQQGQLCPGCLLQSILMNSTSFIDRKNADRMGMRVRVYVNVIDYLAVTAGPKLLAGPKTLGTQLFDLRRNYGDYTHPHTGRRVSVIRSGAGKRVTYTATAANTASPLENMSWIQMQHDLAALVQTLPQDDICERLGTTMQQLLSDLDKSRVVSIPKNSQTKRLVSSSATVPADLDTEIDNIPWK